MAAIASWMEDQRWILILFWIFFNFRTTDAAIFLDGDTNRTVYVGESPHIKWTFDNAEKMTSIDWYFKNTSATITIMTFQPALTPPLIIHSNFNVEHVSGGEIQLTNVKLWNAGTYTCYVTYNISLSIPAETGIVNVAVEEGCTCTSDGHKIKVASIVAVVLVALVFIVVLVVLIIVLIWTCCNQAEQAINNLEEKVCGPVTGFRIVIALGAGIGLFALIVGIIACSDTPWKRLLQRQQNQQG